MCYTSPPEVVQFVRLSPEDARAIRVLLIVVAGFLVGISLLFYIIATGL